MDRQVLIGALKAKRKIYDQYAKPKNVEQMSDDEVASYDSRRMVARHLISRIDYLIDQIDSPFILERYHKFLDEERLIMKNCRFRFDD